MTTVTNEFHEQLESTAKALVERGRGILAADESSPTIAKRFGALNIPDTEEKHREYREMLFTTPGIADFISGVILYDETIRQSTTGGLAFPEYLKSQGIIPGIKVDLGTEPLALSPEDVTTKGIDTLAERLAEYVTLGARFAKWRAVIKISAITPHDAAIENNAELLAEYAAICQNQGIVPIVEPEVLMDGSHDFDRCREVTRLIQMQTMVEMAKRSVLLSGVLLKPNMITAGKDAVQQSAPEEVAQNTTALLKETVPAQIAGIVFLSGGQTEQQAALHLSLMNRLGDMPWPLSFSYGRALQNEALKTWNGDSANSPAAQQVFYKRAKLMSLAAKGEYESTMES